MPRPASLLAVVSVIALAGSSTAEVRLARAAAGAPARVQIVETPTGPWTPNGRIDYRVLNPMGDLHLDGRPATSALGTEPIVAWQRSADNSVVVATGSGTWQIEAVLGSSAAEAAPRVVAWDDQWLVAWNADDAEIRLGWRTQRGVVRDLGHVADGRLVGLILSSDRIHVLSIQERSSGVVGTTASSLRTGRLVDVVAILPTPTPDPIILRTERVATLAESVVLPIARARGQARLATAEPVALVGTDCDSSIVAWMTPEGVARAAVVSVGDVSVVADEDHAAERLAVRLARSACTR